MRVLSLCLLLAACAAPTTERTAPSAPPPTTFSILGYDPETGEIGGAVASKVFSVGNGVIWAEPGAGAVATQSYVDVSYGPKGLALLRQGKDAEAVVQALLAQDEDPHPNGWPKEGRQLAVLDAKGSFANYDGPKAAAWAGRAHGEHCSAQGNILAGEEVVQAMVKAFEATEGHLSQRLVAALEAGEKAGGDTRGKQSAMVLVVAEDGGWWLNQDTVLRLQVDDHEEPVQELRRLVDKGVGYLRRYKR